MIVKVNVPVAGAVPLMIPVAWLSEIQAGWLVIEYIVAGGSDRIWKEAATSFFIVKLISVGRTGATE